MIRGFAVLLSCQLIGEIASPGLGLPVPGPVLGLVLLAIGLHFRHRQGAVGPETWEHTDAVRVADGLLRNLALFFVPAGVGVVQYLGLLKAQALALGIALVGSTLITLLATVLVFVGVSRRLGAGRDRA